MVQGLLLCSLSLIRPLRRPAGFSATVLGLRSYAGSPTERRSRWVSVCRGYRQVWGICFHLLLLFLLPVPFSPFSFFLSVATVISSFLFIRQPCHPHSEPSLVLIFGHGMYKKIPYPYFVTSLIFYPATHVRHRVKSTHAPAYVSV